jgi:hypothetical protein
VDVRGPGVRLSQLVSAFANCLVAVDKECAGYITSKGREYQPGIGPYPENRAMTLVAVCMTANGLPCEQFLPYPNAPRLKCDLGMAIRPPGRWR